MQNSTKAGTEEVTKELDKFAKQASETFTKSFNENLTQNFATKINEAVSRSQGQVGQAGDRIGDTIGQRVSQRITENITRTVRESNGRLRDDRTRVIGGGGNGDEHVTVRDRDSERVHVDVDVDKQSLFAKLAGFGKEAGERFGGFFGDGFKSVLGGIFSGDFVSTLIKGALITLGAGALAPALGATITSGILLALGGGAIGIGVAGALQNPRIQTAIEGIKGKIKSMFAEFSGNFLGPLENFFAPGNGGGGGIVGVLDQVQSMIQSIGRTFGPVAENLSAGIIGFLQNALPGILRAVDAAAPIVDTLADELPGIGDAIGDFFDSIRDGAPGATVFFKDLLNFVEWLIPKIGILIEAFTNMYIWVRQTFLRLNILAADWAYALITAASAAFSWIPGLQPKLLNARKTIEKFRDGANRALHDVDDVDINVRFHVFGLATANSIINTTRTLARMGYIGKAAGGAVGQVSRAASGGARSNRVLVGEDGPEVVDLAPGSNVHTASSTRRMLAAGGEGGSYVGVLKVDKTQATSRELIDLLIKALRLEIFNVAGGDVQTALGS
jgi:hypothetical protein